jgi:acetyl-CoA synthetase
VQVPIFSGFAAPAVAQRLQDSEAKVVVTADRSLRRGKWLDMRTAAEEAAGEARSVEHVVTWSRSDGSWDGVELGPGTLPPLEVDSEHPYLLTYTSGTTGKPKGVVHVQGGFLVSIAREVAYQADGHEDDVILFATARWAAGSSSPREPQTSRPTGSGA